MSAIYPGTIESRVIASRSIEAPEATKIIVLRTCTGTKYARPGAQAASVRVGMDNAGSAHRVSGRHLFPGFAHVAQVNCAISSFSQRELKVSGVRTGRGSERFLRLDQFPELDTPQLAVLRCGLTGAGLL